MPVTLVKSKWSSGSLVFYESVAGNGAQVVFGLTGSGLDVLFYGATSGSYALWDESADALKLEEATLLLGGRASSGDGVTVVATDGGQQRALLACADDGGTALGAGWCQAILGSMEVYTAVASGNPSIFGTSGELWLNESVTTTGNLSGIQGAAVVKTGKTVTGNIFGVTLGAVFPTGAVLASGYYTGGAIIGGHYAGTMTGNVVGIFFQNPTSAAQQFDYAFAFGQNDAFAGCVAVAAVGGSQTHKLKVIAGGTPYFIPMYTA